MQKQKPLNDFIFGKTFGEKEQLLSLLNAILEKTKQKSWSGLKFDRRVGDPLHRREKVQRPAGKGHKK